MAKYRPPKDVRDAYPDEHQCFAIRARESYFALMFMGTMETGIGTKRQTLDNLVFFHHYRSKRPPTMAVFMKRQPLIQRYANWENEQLLAWIQSDRTYEEEHLIPIGLIPRIADDTTLCGTFFTWPNCMRTLEIIAQLPDLDYTGPIDHLLPSANRP